MIWDQNGKLLPGNLCVVFLSLIGRFDGKYFNLYVVNKIFIKFISELLYTEVQYNASLQARLNGGQCLKCGQILRSQTSTYLMQG